MKFDSLHQTFGTIAFALARYHFTPLHQRVSSLQKEEINDLYFMWSSNCQVFPKRGKVELITTNPQKGTNKQDLCSQASPSPAFMRDEICSEGHRFFWGSAAAP